MVFNVCANFSQTSSLRDGKMCVASITFYQTTYNLILNDLTKLSCITRVMRFSFTISSSCLFYKCKWNDTQTLTKKKDRYIFVPGKCTHVEHVWCTFLTSHSSFLSFFKFLLIYIINVCFIEKSFPSWFNTNYGNIDLPFKFCLSG